MMSVLEIILSVLSGISATCAIFFGYTAHKRNNKTDHSEAGRKDGILLTEIGYVKAGVDDIKRKQSRQDEQHIEVVQRLSAVESSTKQAHHRLDRIEGKSDL